eukprot:m.26525 g.26525  ORF g.26525 m.26525 type:complete len:768 (-) comp8838_c0_seq1:1398-3701(-)
MTTLEIILATLLGVVGLALIIVVAAWAYTTRKRSRQGNLTVFDEVNGVEQTPQTRRRVGNVVPLTITPATSPQAELQRPPQMPINSWGQSSSPNGQERPGEVVGVARQPESGPSAAAASSISVQEPVYSTPDEQALAESTSSAQTQPALPLPVLLDTWTVPRTEVTIVSQLPDYPFASQTFFAQNRQANAKGTRRFATDIVVMDLTPNKGTYYQQVLHRLGRLNHQNVQAFYGCSPESSGLRVYLEHLESVSLHTVCAKLRQTNTSLQPFERLDFAIQIACGMEHLHSHGIPHGVLCLRSCLLDSYNTVKLADLHVLPHHLTHDMADVLGTPRYAWFAPEVLEGGLTAADTSADLWSLGVVLWELYSDGERPFRTITQQRMIHKLRAGARLEPPDECPSEVYQVMEASWALIPLERPSAQTVLRHLIDIRRSTQFQLKSHQHRDIAKILKFMGVHSTADATGSAGGTQLIERRPSTANFSGDEDDDDDADVAVHSNHVRDAVLSKPTSPGSADHSRPSFSPPLDTAASLGPPPAFEDPYTAIDDEFERSLEASLKPSTPQPLTHRPGVKVPGTPIQIGGDLYSTVQRTTNPPQLPERVAAAVASAASDPLAHLSAPWYYPNHQKKAALKQLEAGGMVDGLFLVRPSKTGDTFVLVVCHEAQHHTYRIKRGHDDRFFIHPSTTFGALADLVAFYKVPVHGTRKLPAPLTLPYKLYSGSQNASKVGSDVDESVSAFGSNPTSATGTPMRQHRPQADIDASEDIYPITSL